MPKYAKALLPLFKDEKTIFIISSDFCHWGGHFEYYFMVPNEPVIHKSIEKLDKIGMDLIEKNKLEPFHKYLEETENTICGQQPIMLLLAILEEIAKEAGEDKIETKFVKYD